MVLAVLAGVIPSADLDSSFLLVKAKQLEDVDRCGSLEQEGERSDGHVRGVTMALTQLPYQHFQGSQSKNTCPGNKDQMDKQTAQL